MYEIHASSITHWNVHRFQAFSGCPHSSGTIYFSLNKLPRHLRFKPEYVILVMVISGKGEPSLEQLNRCFDPIFRDVRKLYTGEEGTLICNTTLTLMSI
jgi:hypothetical protein